MINEITCGFPSQKQMYIHKMSSFHIFFNSPAFDVQGAESNDN